MQHIIGLCNNEIHNNILFDSVIEVTCVLFQSVVSEDIKTGTSKLEEDMKCLLSLLNQGNKRLITKQIRDRLVNQIIKLHEKYLNIKYDDTCPQVYNRKNIIHVNQSVIPQKPDIDTHFH